MTPQLETVLEIAGVGTVLLFMALMGLVGLMYLLTMPWPFVRSADTAAVDGDVADATSTVDEAAEKEAQEEQDRQLRAVALAVAVACAQAERSVTVIADTAAGWRHIHRSRRLGQPRARASVRT